MKRATGLMTFAAIVFQHFQILAIAGYPLTIGMIAGVAVVLMLTWPVDLARATFVLGGIILITGSTLLIAGAGDDFGRYPRTLALFVLAFLLVSQATTGFDPDMVLSLRAPVFLALLIVVAVSVAQVVTSAAGSQALFNLFGSHQYLYNYQISYGVAGVARAQGFFLEPSYDAFVIGACTVFLLLTGRHAAVVLLLGLIGVASTQSATGLLIMALVLCILALRASPSWTLAAGGGLWAMITWLGPYVAGRLGSVDQGDSSASYRLVSPLTILYDVLAHGPLGAPLGSLDRIVASYGLLNGAAEGTSLDNGIYVLIFYFGWVGVIAVGALVAWVLRAIFLSLSRQRTVVHCLGPVWLVCSLLFSGGIMLPEFAFMTCLITLAYRCAGLGIIEPGEEGSAYGRKRQPAAVGRMRDIQ